MLWIFLKWIGSKLRWCYTVEEDEYEKRQYQKQRESMLLCLRLKNEREYKENTDKLNKWQDYTGSLTAAKEGRRIALNDKQHF